MRLNVYGGYDRSEKWSKLALQIKPAGLFVELDPVGPLTWLTAVNPDCMSLHDLSSYSGA